METLPLSDTAEGTSPVELTGLLCFSLYSASLAMNRLYRGLLGELGLTYPQYLVMVVLWMKDGRRVSEIGEQLFLDSATLTPLLKRLASMGLVTRTRATDDERAVNIALTAEGRAMVSHAAEVVSRVACASGMSEDEMTQLRNQLFRLRDNLMQG